jgi:iron complex transport system ATP-binding protein
MLQRVTAQLKSQNITVYGFLSLSIKENNEFIGYDLYDLKRDTQSPFIRKEGEEHWQRMGAYFFIPETLDQAQNIIFHAGDADICIVDEVGPLELEGKGLWPALKKVIYLPSPDYVLVVRDSILENWLGAMGQSRIKIFKASDKELYPKMVQYLSTKDAHSKKS